MKFVIVLRHWCSYLPSRWAQNSRRRDGISFVRFLNHVGSDRHWMRFDRILTNARDAGFDEILPISFDAKREVKWPEL